MGSWSSSSTVPCLSIQRAWHNPWWPLHRCLTPDWGQEHCSRFTSQTGEITPTGMLLCAVNSVSEEFFLFSLCAVKQSINELLASMDWVRRKFRKLKLRMSFIQSNPNIQFIIKETVTNWKNQDRGYIETVWEVFGSKMYFMLLFRAV